jgi:hypothetical protein
LTGFNREQPVQLTKAENVGHGRLHGMKDQMAARLLAPFMKADQAADAAGINPLNARHINHERLGMGPGAKQGREIRQGIRPARLPVRLQADVDVVIRFIENGIVHETHFPRGETSRKSNGKDKLRVYLGQMGGFNLTAKASGVYEK